MAMTGFGQTQLPMTKLLASTRSLLVAGYESVKYDIGRDVSGNRAGYFTDDVLYVHLNNGANLINANSQL